MAVAESDRHIGCRCAAKQRWGAVGHGCGVACGRCRVLTPAVVVAAADSRVWFGDPLSDRESGGC